jgi:hypothetical protein
MMFLGMLCHQTHCPLGLKWTERDSKRKISGFLTNKKNQYQKWVVVVTTMYFRSLWKLFVGGIWRSFEYSE